jgi:hypothetical protein
MKLKRYMATRGDGHRNQLAECLEIGSIAICRETTDNRLHLLYKEDISGLLHEAGYDVQAEEANLPGLGESFNELQHSVYEGLRCEVYLFDGIAVKNSICDGIEFHTKKGLTVSELSELWGELDIDWSEPCRDIHVPQNQMGVLAIQMEQLEYDAWDLLERAPGEEKSAEERIDSIQVFYEEIQQGKFFASILDDMKQSLANESEAIRDELTSVGPEGQAFANEMLDEVSRLIEQAEQIGQEYSTVTQTFFEMR